MDFPSLIARQRAFFRSGETRGLGFRDNALGRLLALLDEYEAEFLEALHRDLGKGAHEAYASEIGFVRGEIRHARARLKHWARERPARAPWIAWPARARVRSEPFGVALVLGPWNYPLQLLLSPLVAAVAAGNCAVLKPSESAPHTAAVLERAVRSHFPDHYLAVVTGGRETAEVLLAERFDKIFFTGGGATGRLVMAAAAKHLTPVTLELGGKCPCIVCPDVPLETTARRIVWGKFLNAGQTCVAPDHLWVHRDIAAPLIAEIKHAIAAFYGGDPKSSADFGRIVHRGHFDRLVALLGDGAVACGGEHDAAALYLAPTVLTGVAEDAPVMTEEIFGPILPVIEFDDLGEVLGKLADRPAPLAVYLFSGDGDIHRRVVDGTRSGGVCINDTVIQILGHDLPFGGLCESGMGAYRGKTGFDCFSHQRSVLRRSTRIDPAFRYPPPNVSLTTLKRLLRWIG